MLKLHVNGTERTFDAEAGRGDLTVAALLDRLEVTSPAVAIEVNRTIIPKSAHDSHRLESGDRVEIVTFVGGG